MPPALGALLGALAMARVVEVAPAAVAPAASAPVGIPARTPTAPASTAAAPETAAVRPEARIAARGDADDRPARSAHRQTWEDYRCAGGQSLQVRYQLGASGSVARLRMDGRTLDLAYDDRSVPGFTVYAGAGYWWQPELPARPAGAARIQLTSDAPPPQRPGGSAAALYRGAPPFGDESASAGSTPLRRDCRPR